MDFGEISNPAYADVDPKKQAEGRHGSQAGGTSCSMCYIRDGR